MEDGIFVVSAENGSAESVVRINTFTGEQEQLLRRGVTEVNDVTVFGVQQIPPPPPPVAVSDTFTMAQQDGQLHVTAPGILANDADPLGQPLKAELVGSPSWSTASSASSATVSSSTSRTPTSSGPRSSPTAS